MSSRAARKRRNPDDRIDDAIKEGNRSYIHKAERFTEQSSPISGVAGSGATTGATIPGAGVLQTSGGTMLGSIAFNPVVVAISDGRINISPDQSGASKSSTYILVTGQGTPDDLLFIDGADKNGQLLYLQGTETQIIILKHAKLLNILGIFGLGTVFVTTTTDHGLSTGDIVNIIGTNNYDINNVTITVDSINSFTYTAVGSGGSETVGLVQNGNIVTPDGEDLVLDGTVSPNGVPVASLIFDPTVEGFGAWRVLDVNIGGGTGDGPPFSDALDIIENSSDPSKLMKFDISGFSVSTTRTFSLPDADGEILVNPSQVDWDLNTFDIFNIDNIQFMSSTGSLSAAAVGITPIDASGLRIQVAANGNFRVTEDDASTIPFEIDTSVNIATFNDTTLRILDTTNDDFLDIVSSDSLVNFNSSVNDFTFSIGASNIVRFESAGITMQGSKDVTGIGTLGMAVGGQGIESPSAAEMRIVTNSLLSIFTNTFSFEFAQFGAEDISGTPIPFLAIEEGEIILSSISEPPNSAASDIGKIFMDSGNSDHLSIKRLAVVVDLEGGGAAGANTTLSNLTSPTAINQHLIPSTSSLTIGISGTTWDNGFFDRLESIISITFSNSSVLDVSGNGLNLDMPIGGSLFLENLGITFMELEPSGITISRDSNAAFNGAILNLQLDSDTPADNDFLGIISFQGNNTSAALETYADIVGYSADVTAGTEDGGIRIGITNDGSGLPDTIFEMTASAGSLQLGFFGVTPVVQQNPATTPAGIRAALVALGLFQ